MHRCACEGRARSLQSTGAWRWSSIGRPQRKCTVRPSSRRDSEHGVRCSEWSEEQSTHSEAAASLLFVVNRTSFQEKCSSVHKPDERDVRARAPPTAIGVRELDRRPRRPPAGGDKAQRRGGRRCSCWTHHIKCVPVVLDRPPWHHPPPAHAARSTRYDVGFRLLAFVHGGCSGPAPTWRPCVAGLCAERRQGSGWQLYV